MECPIVNGGTDEETVLGSDYYSCYRLESWFTFPSGLRILAEFEIDQKSFFFFQNYVDVQSAKNKGEYSTMKLSF